VQQSISPSIQAPSPDGATAHQHQIPISSAELRETDFPKFDLSALEAMSESDRRAHADSMELPVLGRFIRPALTGVKRLVEAYRPYILRFMRRTAHQGQQKVLTNAKGEPADRDEVVRELLGVGVRRINQLLATTDPKAPKPKPSLTPTQDAVVQALVGQGYKKKEAITMVKAAEGNDFDSVFRSALAHRSGGGKTTTPAVEGEREQELDDKEDNSGDQSTGESLQESAGRTTVPGVGPTPAAVTYVDWESYRLPTPDFKLKYFKEATGNFTDRFRHAVQGSAFKKILTMLKDKPQQVLANAHDFGNLAAVVQGAGDNLNLLAAAITTALTHPMEPEPPQTHGSSQKTPMDALETTKVVGGKSSSEIKQLIANPKSHSYNLVALKVALSARLAFEAGQ